MCHLESKPARVSASHIMAWVGQATQPDFVTFQLVRSDDTDGRYASATSTMRLMQSGKIQSSAWTILQYLLFGAMHESAKL